MSVIKTHNTEESRRITRLINYFNYHIDLREILHKFFEMFSRVFGPLLRTHFTQQCPKQHRINFTREIDRIIGLFTFFPLHLLFTFYMIPNNNYAIARH